MSNQDNFGFTLVYFCIQKKKNITITILNIFVLFQIQVAIKCLARERMQNNPIEFLKEAAIMHSIDHAHIVRLYGVVLDTDSLMLVTELAPLRSLLECLKEPALRSSFPVLTLCDFAMQVCDGMQYLEAKKLIHR